MKNTIKLIVIVALLFVAFKATEDEGLSGFDVRKYVTTSELNVRKGAGTSHAVLFTMPKGAQVKVLSKNGKWFQVEYQGKTGYAYSKYIVSKISTPEIISQSPQRPGVILALMFVMTK